MRVAIFGAIVLVACEGACIQEYLQFKGQPGAADSLIFTNLFLLGLVVMIAFVLFLTEEKP